MIKNAHLDNEKQVYTYYLETIKNNFDDLEDELFRIQKKLKSKNRVMVFENFFDVQ